MLKKVKKWLGIEGVKINVVVDDAIYLKDKQIKGQLVFESKQDSEILRLRMRLIEKFSRGRRHEKLIDEYELGQMAMEKHIFVGEDELVELDFVLPFQPIHSEMDKYQDKNILLKGLVKSAKWVRGVKSIYRIEVEVDVKGMAISPLVKKEIKILS
ncbi:hypothetical protein [Membranihabitans marinus]|uniref:hypothetical protein n=1 Tax=Membranihabitans marinus TaxID=1227546 RepID=UPI001F49153A|nr:hypothetical protein [Membranihabitans marinus]